MAGIKVREALVLEHAEAWAARGFRFDRSKWKGLIDGSEDKKRQLVALGLKNPDSPREAEWFLRSFNSLEIAAHLYDLKKAKWAVTADALSDLADMFQSIPELRLLFEYKKLTATARSFISLERQLESGNIAHPKVKRTVTNRLMFVEPYISGLPKSCRPYLPMSEDCVLLSVDVKAQEPTIIVNWFGSESFRKISATEPDIYKGVAKAAFIPKVMAYEGAGASVTTVKPNGGTWLWGAGDTLTYIEDI